MFRFTKNTFLNFVLRNQYYKAGSVPSHLRFIAIWLFTGCFLIYGMVMVGGITRLTGSGLSITEWKLVTGIVPPLSQKAWEEEFEAYKKIPQYQLINSSFTLEDFKNIYWWEYIHRLFGRVIGVVFIIPFLWFWLKKKFPSGFIKKMLFLFFLGGLQGFLGWFMVSSGLTENVYVSHYRLAIHLIAAFAIFGFAFWYALDIAFPSHFSSLSGLRKVALILFSIVILQIIYGAFVAGLKAGYGYPTWPKMGDAWIPDDVLAIVPIWKNFTEGRAGVQFVHRYLAYVVVLLTILLLYRSMNKDVPSSVTKIVMVIGIVVLVQFMLGVLTLIYGVPIVIAILHQTGAFILFALLLFLLHKLR